MKTDDIIAGMCLFGFIRREPPMEQIRCLSEIERHYGRPIAAIVRDLINKN